LGNWKYDRAKKQIEDRFEEVKTVEVVDYTRDTSLDSIPLNKAYGNGTDAVKNLFSSDRLCAHLNYDLAEISMSADGDSTARRMELEAKSMGTPAIAKSIDKPFRPHTKEL
jgi:hypothetical protein